MKIYIDSTDNEKLHLTKTISSDGVICYIQDSKLNVYSLIQVVKIIITLIFNYTSNETDINIHSKLNKEHNDILYHFFCIYKQYYKQKLDKDNKVITLHFGSNNETTDVIAQLFDKYMYVIESRANVINPKTYVGYIKELVKQLNIKVNIEEIICDRDTELQALYGVGKGSEHPPRLLLLHFPQQQDRYEVCLVGKGITYDTGGLSLKSSEHMDNMNIDMGGSALALFASIAAHMLYGTKILCVMAIAENSVSQYSQRPGDIIDSYAKVKIKIQNTDAEGRVVLADAVAYACDKYKFDHMLVFATLTGAAVVVAGEDCGVYFTDNIDVNNAIDTLKSQVGERLVRLNEEEHYFKKMMFEDRNVSGICNIGPRGFGAGTATGFAFIKHFYKQYTTDCKSYTHIDIAPYFEKEPVDNLAATNLLELVAQLAHQLAN